jgi:hypothetical protein
MIHLDIFFLFFLFINIITSQPVSLARFQSLFQNYPGLADLPLQLYSQSHIHKNHIQIPITQIYKQFLRQAHASLKNTPHAELVQLSLELESLKKDILSHGVYDLFYIIFRLIDHLSHQSLRHRKHYKRMEMSIRPHRLRPILAPTSAELAEIVIHPSRVNNIPQERVVEHVSQQEIQPEISEATTETARDGNNVLLPGEALDAIASASLVTPSGTSMNTNGMHRMREISFSVPIYIDSDDTELLQFTKIIIQPDGTRVLAFEEHKFEAALSPIKQKVDKMMEARRIEAELEEERARESRRRARHEERLREHESRRAQNDMAIRQWQRSNSRQNCLILIRDLTTVVFLVGFVLIMPLVISLHYLLKKF